MARRMPDADHHPPLPLSSCLLQHRVQRSRIQGDSGGKREGRMLRIAVGPFQMPAIRKCRSALWPLFLSAAGPPIWPCCRARSPANGCCKHICYKEYEPYSAPAGLLGTGVDATWHVRTRCSDVAAGLGLGGSAGPDQGGLGSCRRRGGNGGLETSAWERS